MNRREIEDFLIEKCLVDPSFREKLATDPHSTLSALGLPVSEKAKINVVVEEPGVFTIVLPHVLPEPEELTEGQLDGVTGGASSPVNYLFGGYV